MKFRYRNEDEMKDSGVKWINKIPKEWELIKIKNIAIRKNSKAEQKNPTISLARSGIKVRNISNNEGQLAESYYNYNPVSKGDFLLNPMDLYSGANCNVSSIEGVISPAYINLRTTNENNVKFLDYYLKTQYWSMALFAHGKGVSFENRWTLNNETLMNYYIPYTTVKEQEKIANFLDEKTAQFDTIISKKEDLIKRLEEAKKSLISEVVTGKVKVVKTSNGYELVERKKEEMKDSGVEWIGTYPNNWTLIKLKYEVDTIKGFAFKTDIFVNAGVQVIKASDIKNGTILKGTTFISPTVYSMYEKVSLKVGDIIMSTVGSTPDVVNSAVGQLAIVPKNIEGSLLNQNTVILKPRKNIDNEFMFMGLNGVAFRKYLDLYAHGTANQSSLSLKDILDFPIAIPILEEQKSIVIYLKQKINEMDNSILKTKIQVEKLKEAKQSLISEAVTGKIEILD